MSGSFHLSIFVFRQFWQRSYQNQLSFSGKDRTADFFVFGHFDQNTKNEKWNEPDIRPNRSKKSKMMLQNFFGPRSGRNELDLRYVKL